MSSLGIFDKETKTYKKVADLSKTAVIDSAMSDTSTNAVQNKVVKSYVDTHTTFDSAMSDTSTNAVQNKVIKSYVDGRTSSVAWNNITDKPSTYTPSSHTHTKSQITDFPSSLPANGGNASTVNGHTVNSNVPANAKFTDTTYGDATTSAHGLMTPAMVTKLNGIAEGANRTTVDSAMSDTSTNPVQNNVVKSYVDNGVNSAKKLQTYKQGSTTETYGDAYPVYAQWRDNSHVKMKCDNYTVETDYATSAGSASSVAWNNVSGKPSTYTPSSHTHTKSQITDFPSSLPANGGNASTVNGHTVNSDVPSGAKFTDTTYGDATTSAHGLMTPAMVTKLNGIAEGANRTTVDTSMSSTSTNAVQNKAVKSYVDGRTILDSAMSDSSNNAVQNKVVKSYVDTHTTLDTSMSDSSTKAVQNKVVKSYVDGKFKQKLLAVMPGDGKTSYCQLCTIKITQNYIDTPIEITVQERGRATVDKLTVLFSSSDNIDPALRSFKVFGEFGDWYISKRAASTWIIYGQKSEQWATIKVVDYIGIDGVNVTWDVTGVTALPNSKTKASWGGNVNYATSAGSASSVAWNNITDKPSTYTPSSHTHTKSQITDFPSSLPANGGNASTVNGHTVNSNVPANAKFTDTTYGDATTSAHGLMTPAMVTKLNGIAEGANRTTVDTSMSGTSTNPVQNKAVKSYVDNGLNTLKKSVSDGKTKVANAITDKGVETATDATFDVMAENISKIETGGGELHGATLAVNTSESVLFGKTVTLTLNGANVGTTVFASNGTCSFVVQNPGTYTITCGEADNKVTVTGDNIVNKTVISVELSLLKIVAFATGTDKEIAKMIQAHYNDKINIADYWAVGDTRSVSLSAMSATGVGESHRAQDVKFVIGDFEHDDLATPINGHTKAAVTLLQKDCLMDASNASNPVNGSGNTENGYMNSSATNVGGWKSCARRAWCNNVFFVALPSTWQSMVKIVNKKSGTGGGSSSGTEITADKIFLAAEIEIFGSTLHSVVGEGTQYQYYKNAIANRYKMPKWISGYDLSAYLERSPERGSNYTFCIVSAVASASSDNAVYAYGIAPCLCI